MRFAFLLLLILGVIGILLATQDANLTNEVRLALPFTDADWTGPVLWMIGGWFGAGLLLGYLVALPGRVGASMRARKIEKQLGTTEVKKDKAVSALNTSAPISASRTTPPATEADEMQRLADEVARRTESVQATPPPKV
ncbi:LapA family protein [Rubrivirga sp.]|uniref:LapA family protein n=1 Tax=Rubrivirga sp. TaxID=1885344 RepID=UPI003C7353FB